MGKPANNRQFTFLTLPVDEFAFLYFFPLFVIIIAPEKQGTVESSTLSGHIQKIITCLNKSKSIVILTRHNTSQLLRSETYGFFLISVERVAHAQYQSGSCGAQTTQMPLTMGSF